MLRAGFDTGQRSWTQRSGVVLFNTVGRVGYGISATRRRLLVGQARPAFGALTLLNWPFSGVGGWFCGTG